MDPNIIDTIYLSPPDTPAPLSPNYLNQSWQSLGIVPLDPPQIMSARVTGTNITPHRSLPIAKARGDSTAKILARINRQRPIKKNINPKASTTKSIGMSPEDVARMIRRRAGLANWENKRNAKLALAPPLQVLTPSQSPPSGELNFPLMFPIITALIPPHLEEESERLGEKRKESPKPPETLVICYSAKDKYYLKPAPRPGEEEPTAASRFMSPIASAFLPVKQQISPELKLEALFGDEASALLEVIFRGLFQDDPLAEPVQTAYAGTVIAPSTST